MRTRILGFTTLVALLLCAGCRSQSDQQTVERIRIEVAKVLGKSPAEIDVAKPLGAQGAEELHIVEIVRAVERAFEVQIPESAVGKNLAEVRKTLTVESLADIVSKQKQN
jgi:acyl carrier protein